MGYTFDAKEVGVFKFPVYHTIHDNFEWLTKFVDPDFRYHTTIAKVLTQMVLSFADSTLLPFNFIRYSSNLYRRVKLMENIAHKEGVTDICDYSMLKKVTQKLKTAAAEFHKYLDNLDTSDVLAVRRANDKITFRADVRHDRGFARRNIDASRFSYGRSCKSDGRVDPQSNIINVPERIQTEV